MFTTWKQLQNCTTTIRHQKHQFLPTLSMSRAARWWSACMHNRCASFQRRLPSWLDAPYGMLSLTDHACWRLMRCFQFEPWCIAVKKERLNMFWRTSQPPWTFGPFLFFFCHKLKCLQFATPRFAITHEPSQPKHPDFSRTWVYTHTHCLTCIYSYTYHRCMTTVLLDDTTRFVRQSFMLDIQNTCSREAWQQTL